MNPQCDVFSFSAGASPRLQCVASLLFSLSFLHLCFTRTMSHLMCTVRTATLTTDRSCSDPVESHAAWSLSLRGSGRAVTPSSRTPPLSFSYRGSRVLRLPQVLGFSCSLVSPSAITSPCRRRTPAEVATRPCAWPCTRAFAGPSSPRCVEHGARSTATSSSRPQPCTWC